MIETGQVKNVVGMVAGSRLAQDVTLGVTSTFAVEDASDFNPDGGQVRVTTLDTGATVSDVYTYLSADLDADTITVSSAVWARNAFDGDRVDVWPLQSQRVADIVLDGTGESVAVTLPHYLRDLVDEGLREPSEQETVYVELIQNQWVLRDVNDSDPSLRSPDYREGEAGWRLDQDSSEFANVAVMGEVGAGLVTADAFTLGGRDLEADILSPMPLGIIVQCWSDSGVNTEGVTSETIAFQINAGSLYNARMYRVSYGGTVAYAADAGDVFLTQLRYTVNGATPTLSSGVIKGSPYRWNADDGTNPTAFERSFYYSPGGDYDTVKFAWTMQRLSGTGTCMVKGDDPVYNPWFAIEDMGLQANVGGTIQQVSKYGGAAADPAPGATYTKTWPATWSQSYDGNDGKRDGEANTSSCYQGYYSGTHGNTKSLVGFDDAAIRSALSGATVLSTKLTFRVQHAYYNDGLDVRVKSHNHASKPSTYSAGGSVDSRDNSKEGSTYTVTLPGSFGTDLKAGNARGVAFYGPSTDRHYYGYLYGYGSGHGPTLTITYSK